ncbi:MAG: YncE family protein [Hyphomicrobiales bacterium]|nr:YncE family protein [Hyphomicrobiales bacterium]
MRDLPAATVALLAIFVVFAVPASASRIFVPLHKQGGILVVDDRRQTPNVALGGIPGVHSIASDKKFLALAITDGTGNSRLPQIVLIDVRQPTPLAVIPLPGAGGHAAVSPDSRFAAVVHPDLRSVSLINLRARKILTTLPIDGEPKGVVFSRDSRQLFVSDSESGKLNIVSIASPNTAETIEGLDTTGHLVAGADGKLLYTANDSAGEINIISLKTKKTVSTLRAGGAIHGIDISPDGKTIYAADFEDNKVIAIDVVAGGRQAVDIQPAPYHITALSGTDQIVVTSAEQEVMWSIAVPSMTLIGKYGLEGITDQIAEVEASRR